VITGLDDFEEIIVLDFEFQMDGGLHTDRGLRHGGRPLPLCCVALELRSGRVWRLWRDDLLKLTRAPFNTGRRALVVAFFASAEAGCFTALGWPFPHHWLCLHAEFRLKTNGLSANKSVSLLDALAAYRLPAIGAAEKEALREKILTQRYFSIADQKEILDYCESDGRETAALLGKMAGKLDFPRCLLRGRYTAACGRMEWNGIPLDTKWWDRFNTARVPLLHRLVKELDRDGIYDGLVFKRRQFGKMLAHHKIPWARTEHGELLLEAEYFRDQALLYPPLQPLHQLRETIKKFREPKLAIGPDYRNRTLIGPWGTITGRNAPSTNKTIFGPDRWARFTILPPTGSSLAYVDWSAQEIGIAAFLSKDERLIATYLAVDPYLYFAELAGMISPGTTRGPDWVEVIRDRVKWLFLGVNYGMSVSGLARRLGVAAVEARELLQKHRALYPTYWRWIERVLDNTDMRSRDWTMFGWAIRVIDDAYEPRKSTKIRTLMNWPAQAHGAEMMRLPAIELTENSVQVDFPVHDAFLVEGPDRDIVDIAHYTQEVMGRAGRAMFGETFKAKIHLFPERRFEDDRQGSREMWERVNRILDEEEDRPLAQPSHTAAAAPWV
jgi:hypothetical protein